MPTLLSVNNYHYRRGGADVVALDQGRLLEARGWDVVPFAMAHPDNEPSPWSRYFVDEIELGNDYGAIGNAIRAGRAIYSLQARRRLGELVDRVRPDVAHVHNLYHHISPSILSLLRARGIPTVMTTHDLKLACPAYRMLTHDGICERCKDGNLRHAVVNRCMKGSLTLSTVVFAEAALHRTLGSYIHNIDRFVTPSAFYRDKFVEWGFDPSRFVHIPNYVEVGEFAPDPRPGTRFAYVGRLSEEKGIATLVRAAGAAGVPVDVIGTGPEREALEKLVADVGADVTFAGYLTGPPLHERIRRARALVLPSEWYENGPISVLEAYALGTPVVGARIGGIGELIREGETGYAFESGSVADLTGVLRKVADLDDRQVEALGGTARAWAEQEFSSERYVERLLDLYRQVGVATG